MTNFVKAYSGENVQSGNVVGEGGGGGCPFREVSVGEVSGRESIRRGTVL